VPIKPGLQTLSLNWGEQPDLHVIMVRAKEETALVYFIITDLASAQEHSSQVLLGLFHFWVSILVSLVPRLWYLVLILVSLVSRLWCLFLILVSLLPLWYFLGPALLYCLE